MLASVYRGDTEVAQPAQWVPGGLPGLPDSPGTPPPSPGSALTVLLRLSGRPGEERRLGGPALLHVQNPSQDPKQEERGPPGAQEEEEVRDAPDPGQHPSCTASEPHPAL